MIASISPEPNILATRLLISTSIVPSFRRLTSTGGSPPWRWSYTLTLAPVDDAAHRAGVHRPDLAVYKALVAAIDAEGFEAVRADGPYNGANGGVHAGRIAAACQNANASNPHGPFDFPV